MKHRSLPLAAALAAALALAAAPGAARAQIPAGEYAARRAALAAALEGDGVVLALGAREPTNDYQSFFQASDFLYLTGIREPNAALVMVKRGGEVATMVFVDPRDPAREVWSGHRMGTEGARERTGMEARTSARLRPTLDSLLRVGGAGTRLFVVGDYAPRRQLLTVDDQLVRAIVGAHAGVEARSASQVVAELRGKKSAAELDLIRKAVEITVDAHREAARLIEPGMNEFEAQAVIEYTFRRYGADRPSFATIVGSGPNSTTLHYNANDRFMEAGDVVVMDIGASYRGYAADVTRTVPVSGTFTAEQRAIYGIVRDAQAAAERQAKPGVEARLMNDSATAVIAAGLARLGLIESPTATYDCAQGEQAGACPQVTLYYYHGLGHGIGLDVHDPEQYYFTGTIAAGSAFTIEPGVYVRGNLAAAIPDTPRNRAMLARIGPAVRRHANIGVRIEDDYIVTERGTEWISRAPREADEIEALMREAYAGPARRDATKVDWYRKSGR